MLYVVAFLITVLWIFFLVEALIAGGAIVIIPILALVFLLFYVICGPAVAHPGEAGASDPIDSRP